MANIKSPYIVVKNFISPALCESIVDKLNFIIPNENHEGELLPMIKSDEKCEKLIFDRLKPLIDNIQKYYGFDYYGTEHIEFNWYPISTSEKIHCENSEYLRNKWARTKVRDITGIIFFSDYNNNDDFDTDYEVYGGKLEFPQHNFSINAERGTMILFPSGPHFLNAISEVFIGDLYFAKFHICAKTPYLHDPSKFPGDYTQWFKNL